MTKCCASRSAEAASEARSEPESSEASEVNKAGARGSYAENDSPQPQELFAFGFWILKPDSISEST